MQKSSISQFFIALICLMFVFSANAHEKALTDREDVKTFVNMMVKKHHFDAVQLKSWLNKAKIQPNILTTIAKPAEKLPWHRYEPIFLTQKRIDEGVAFWKQNRAALAKAEKE